MEFKTKEEAEAAISAGREFVWAMEFKQRMVENAPYIGGFYRIQSNYSMPQKPSDYWWVYTAVTGIDDDGFLTGWRFSRDCHGKIEIEPKVERVYPHIYLRCKVSREIFYREFGKVIGAAQRVSKDGRRGKKK